MSKNSTKKISGIINYKKLREEKKMFVLEHPKAIFDLIKNQSELIKEIFIREKTEFNLELNNSFNKITILKENEFKKITKLKHSPGIIAILSKPVWDLSKVIKRAQNVAILDGVANPGNFGAIIRNAYAFSLSAVFYFSGTVDPFHPESVNASVGTILKMPVIKITEKDLKYLEQDGFQGFILSAKEGQNIKNFIKTKSKKYFVFGSEGSGLQNPDLFNKCEKLNIKINSELESLNVAVSSGILFYELS